MDLTPPKEKGYFSTPRQEAFLLGLMALVTLVYTFLSCVRQWRFATGGWDMGTFDQIAWQWSRGLPPSSTLLHLSNSLGDHFNPILILAAPFYWVLGRPEVLFFIQAFCVALGLLPVYRFACRRLGQDSAFLWACAYPLFWGLQNALGYDFHPDLFAVPMIAFAVDFADEGKNLESFIALALLLTVKEDLGLLIAGFGLYLFFLDRWKWGFLCLGFGLCAFFFEVGYLVPHLRGTSAYPHWPYAEIGASPLEAFGNVIRHPLRVFQSVFFNLEKVQTMACTFAACAFLIFLSPLFVVTLPLLAERMLSSVESIYSMGYHYSAILGPLLMMGGADGLYRWALRWSSETQRRKWVKTLSWIVLSLNLATVPIFPLRDLFRAKFYDSTPVIVAGHKMLSLIPASATVVAQDTIVPHLSHRVNVFMIDKDSLDLDCDYFAACRFLPAWPLDRYEPIEINIEEKIKQGYLKVFEGEGWVLLKNGKRTFE